MTRTTLSCGIIDGKWNMAHAIDAPLYPAIVTRISREGLEVRDRIIAWLKVYLRDYADNNQRRAARLLGVSQSVISKAISPDASKKRGVGLDLLIALHQKLHEKADIVMWTYPPTEAAHGRTSSASTEPAETERRHSDGGRR